MSTNFGGFPVWQPSPDDFGGTNYSPFSNQPTANGSRRISVNAGSQPASAERRPPAPDSYLICPFGAADRVAHDACRVRKIRDMSDLRTHLRRKHKRPLHCCPTCYLVFVDQKDGKDPKSLCDAHVRLRQCRSRTPNVLPFITKELYKRIDEVTRTKGRGKRTPEKFRWYQLWEILFPQISPPRLHYRIPGERLEHPSTANTPSLQVDVPGAEGQGNPGNSQVQAGISFPSHGADANPRASIVPNEIPIANPVSSVPQQMGNLPVPNAGPNVPPASSFLGAPQSIPSPFPPMPLDYYCTICFSLWPCRNGCASRWSAPVYGGEGLDPLRNYNLFS